MFPLITLSGTHFLNCFVFPQTFCWFSIFFLFFLQIGRSSESPIDFVVMDTQPGDKKDTKVLQSTISRFACRLLVDRTESSKARIYAAGFDSSRNIFLGVSLVLFLEQFYLFSSRSINIWFFFCWICKLHSNMQYTITNNW